jgi:hypothetical protein
MFNKTYEAHFQHPELHTIFSLLQMILKFPIIPYELSMDQCRREGMIWYVY